MRLEVDPCGWEYVPESGASIAIEGCCLTVASLEGGQLGFDVIPQTIDLTTLGHLSVGARVNMEHAARMDTLLGGHIVQGHVDGVGEVVAASDDGADRRVRVRVDASWAGLLVPQGSIAVSGVSLTLAAVGPNWFEVALIPITLAETTLGDRAPGDQVNLEFDIFAKMLERQLALRGRSSKS